jgi:D-3-phosphoglycerate dehydrogenase
VTEPDTVDALVLDLLEWIGSSPRPYDEVMEAWRTSCPRLPVWETANERGFVERLSLPRGGPVVSVSAAGAAHLQAQRSLVRA